MAAFYLVAGTAKKPKNEKVEKVRAAVSKPSRQLADLVGLRAPTKMDRRRIGQRKTLDNFLI
jgi:hypothetical protein